MEENEEKQVKKVDNSNYKERFQFILKVNDHIICQRYFRINRFNSDSLCSEELLDTLRGVVQTIKSDLVSKSRVYLWATQGGKTKLTGFADKDGIIQNENQKGSYFRLISNANATPIRDINWCWATRFISCYRKANTNKRIVIQLTPIQPCNTANALARFNNRRQRVHTTRQFYRPFHIRPSAIIIITSGFPEPMTISPQIFRQLLCITSRIHRKIASKRIPQRVALCIRRIRLHRCSIGTCSQSQNYRTAHRIKFLIHFQSPHVL